MGSRTDCSSEILWGAQEGLRERAIVRPWLLLAGISIAAIMDAVNGTVLVLARGHMMGSTHATPDEIAWVNIAYLAAKLTAFPVGAWLTLRFDPARLLLAATLLLLGSSAACAAAADLTQLVAWRIAQGLGGAVLLVAGQTLLFEIFPRRRQGLVQAVFAFGAIMAPAAVSPALQGWAVDTLSWSWIFLANLPLGLVSLIVFLGLPRQERRRGAGGRFDWLGVAVLGLGMTCIVFVLQEGSRYDWFEEPKIVSLTIAGLLALIAFLAWEVRAPKSGPLVDFAVLRDQHFAFGFIVSFVAGCALFGSSFVIPAFAIGVLELSPTYAGVLLLPSGGLICFSLLAAGALIQLMRMPPFKLIPFGIACFMTAMWMLSGATAESGIPDMTPALLLRGLGLGFLFIPLTLITLLDLEGRLVAHGVALFNIGRQLGGLIGIALLSAYLDRQVALNRNVLSQNLVAGDPALVERQGTVAGILTARGYDADEASAAVGAVIQRTLQEQAATLSFNECFLAIALLFVAAAPVLIAAKLLLGRLVPHDAPAADPAISARRTPAGS